MVNGIIAFVLATILVGGYYAITRAWLPYFLISLGDKDVWYSPVRVKPPFGQYAIMRKMTRRKGGDFDRIIHSIENHWVSREHAFVEGADPRGPNFFDRTWGDKYGLVLVWFFKQYFIRPTEYAAIDKVAGSRSYDAVDKKRNMNDEDPYYFFQYSNMYVEAKSAEIGGNAEVDMELLVTLRHRNPYKVHGLAGKWTVRGTAAVEKGSREYVRNKLFATLRDEHGAGADSLVQYLKLQGDIPPYVVGMNPDNITAKYGLEIDDPELISLELVGSQKVKDAMVETEVQRNLADAAVERKRGTITDAEAKKAATILEAEATRDAAKIRAEGIREEFAARMSVPEGADLSWAEAVRESSPDTIVLGAATVSVPTRSSKTENKLPEA